MTFASNCKTSVTSMSPVCIVQLSDSIVARFSQFKAASLIFSAYQHICRVRYICMSVTRVDQSTRSVISQGNRAMQRVFPMLNDSIVICFSSRKVKAVIAPSL